MLTPKEGKRGKKVVIGSYCTTFTHHKFLSLQESVSSTTFDYFGYMPFPANGVNFR